MPLTSPIINKLENQSCRLKTTRPRHAKWQAINENLKERMAALDSPLMPLGIGAEVAATILAESGAITRFHDRENTRRSAD